MPLTRDKLYIFLIIACTAGYIWVFLNLSYEWPENNSAGVCLIKSATNIPCPSCGSTRSVISLIHGDFTNSLYWNPFGLILILIMVIAPIWITYDLLKRNDTLLRFYLKVESIFRRREIALPAIALVIVNWIWNISKGL